MKVKKSMWKYLSGGFLLVALVVLSGCTEGTVTAESSQKQAQDVLESTQKKLQNSVPVPSINNSQTRKAIAERAKLFDAENKITYIYLISYGNVMAFYPVKGQVVSLRSYLTPTESIVRADGVPCKSEWDCTLSNGGGASGYIVQSPDIDGTYGDNADGIFFFTADSNAYVEWRGEYLVSDQALDINQPVRLTKEVK